MCVNDCIQSFFSLCLSFLDDKCMQIKFLQEFNVHKAWRRLTEQQLCWTITGGPWEGSVPGGPRCQCNCHCYTGSGPWETGLSLSHLDSPPLSSFCLFNCFSSLLCLVEIDCVLLDADKVSLPFTDHHWSAAYIPDTALKIKSIRVYSGCIFCVIVTKYDFKSFHIVDWSPFPASSRMACHRTAPSTAPSACRGSTAIW